MYTISLVHSINKKGNSEIGERPPMCAFSKREARAVAASDVPYCLS